MNAPLAKALVGEVVGTFVLVFVGCGAIMVDAKTHQLGHLGVALAFGLVVTAMIYAVGGISGAHLNAAVTFAFVLTRHFPWSRLLPYWAAQLVGGLAAASVLRLSLDRTAHLGATLPTGSEGQSFVWEVVLSAILMLVVMAVATGAREVGEAAAVAVGATVGLDALVGGPVSGASMNPVRSLAPALVSGDLHALWIYLLAPMVGTAVGGLVYEALRPAPVA